MDFNHCLNPFSDKGKKELEAFTKFNPNSNEVTLVDNEFLQTLISEILLKDSQGKLPTEDTLNFIFRILAFNAQSMKDSPSPILVQHLLNTFNELQSMEEKRYCLEMIAGQMLGQTTELAPFQVIPYKEVVQNKKTSSSSFRPKTSRPKSTLTSSRGRTNLDFEKFDVMRAYETSYERHYPQYRMKSQPIASLERVEVEDLHVLEKHYETTYGRQFTARDNTNCKQAPIRTGSSSGNRRNNPHPSKAFMHWQARSHRPMSSPLYGLENESGLNDRRINELLKRTSNSTYQSDYLGAPLGVNLKSAFYNDSKFKAKKQELKSSAQISYQPPAVDENTKSLHRTRFGFTQYNTKLGKGIVPTIEQSDVAMQLTPSETHYDKEFNDRRPKTSYSFKSEPIDADEKDLIFKRARSARVNSSLTYRKALQPTTISFGTSIWPGPL